MRELQPLNENVLLEIPEKGEERTSGGIIIPDTAKEKPLYGKVIAIGDTVEPHIKIGDTVYYKEYSGNEFKFDDKKFMIIPYSDLLVKIVETEEI
jgi:chaperonin GroES